LSITGFRANRAINSASIALLLLLCLCGSTSAQNGAGTAILSSGTLTRKYTRKLLPLTTPLPDTGLASVDDCDLNADGRVDITDVQLAVNQALHLAPCTDADLHLNNTCTVLDVQVIVSDIETGTCLVPNCKSPLTYPSTNRNPSTAPACPPMLPTNPNPPNSTSQDDGPIHPCMYVSGGVRFQAIAVTGVSGQQALNANLYLGATCAPTNLIDTVFGGQLNPFFGNSLYWLTHFWDQPGTSAVWTVGNTTTSCINYSKVPDCN